MTLSAGKRLQGLRVLLRLNQNEFADILGVKLSRLQNVEKGTAKMSETEFAGTALFPAFSHYLTHEGEISLSDLKKSKNRLEQVAYSNIKAKFVPTGYLFEEKIK